MYDFDQSFQSLAQEKQQHYWILKNPQCHHAALQSLFFFVSLSLFFSDFFHYFIGFYWFMHLKLLFYAIYTSLFVRDTIFVQQMTWINHFWCLLQEKQPNQKLLMGHQCHQRTAVCLDFVSIYIYIFQYIFLKIFWLFSHILSDFIGLCIWNCLFWKSTASRFVNFNRDTIFMTWINHLWGLWLEKQQHQWILMDHQFHQWTVAPSAPQPLGKFLCSLWKSHSNTPL